MNKKLLTVFLSLSIVLGFMMSVSLTANAESDSQNESSIKISLRNSSLLKIPKNLPQEFFYDSGITIPYPLDGVKGIYVQAKVMGKNPQSVIKFLNDTPLNSIVLDVRDDHGHITLDLPTDNHRIGVNTTFEIPDRNALMKNLEENQIYPIARIVAFKDTTLSFQRPDLSFKTQKDNVWTNGGGEAYLNPFKKENWEYAAEIAIASAKAGFKEVQLDYVRFPEGFEVFANNLVYDKEDYAQIQDDGQARVAAITEFIAFIREKLKPYGVKLSVDIFGYAATIDEASGIGQNFSKIAQEVDTISSMIYPSHWGEGSFNILSPDKEPYKLVYSYMKMENDILSKINPSPISRPWLQDFTAPYLGEGNYQVYGAKQVSEQIQALKDTGIKEYLIWNANTDYSDGVEY